MAPGRLHRFLPSALRAVVVPRRGLGLGLGLVVCHPGHLRRGGPRHEGLRGGHGRALGRAPRHVEAGLAATRASRGGRRGGRRQGEEEGPGGRVQDQDAARARRAVGEGDREDGGGATRWRGRRRRRHQPAARLVLREQGGQMDVKGKKKICNAIQGRRDTSTERSDAGAGWRAPEDGWIKINVDGSFVDQTNEASVGVIARDQSGSVLFTAWRVLFNCMSAAEAEARAAVEGLRLASQWCQGPVILETDCISLVNALSSAGRDKSELCFVIAEAQEIGRTLAQWRVVKVKREDNRVAHELAKLARQNVHTAMWLGRAPACVLELISMDCNNCVP